MFCYSCVGNCSTVIHNYMDNAEPGTFTITLKVSNHMSSETTSRTIILQRRVQGIGVTTSDSSVVKNITTWWTLSFGSFGTDACYFVNFDDPSAGTASPYLAY